MADDGESLHRPSTGSGLEFCSHSSPELVEGRSGRHDFDMAAWVYILRCADRSYYTGVTVDLERRLDQHANSVTGYTAKRKPFDLVWTEEFANLDDAQAFERQVKGWRRSKKEALMRGDWPEIQRLARKKAD